MNEIARIAEAIQILVSLGMPSAQQNDRSGLCLLALLDLKPDKPWTEVGDELIGITPIMEWVELYYGREYAPNSRESFRRQTMHQFLEAGIATINPDKPSRAINSPNTVYQIEPNVKELITSYKTNDWKSKLSAYLSRKTTLTEKYAREREQQLVQVVTAEGMKINLSSGEHSELLKDIIEQFAPRFVPGAKLIYVGDTGEKWAYFDEDLLHDIGVLVDAHGKMPDVVLYSADNKWLLLVESVTSHGPVDGKRYHELFDLFKNASAGIVYVTAFPSKSIMARYVGEIAWETEVWISENPSHLIHFDGERFLGPYSKP